MSEQKKKQLDWDLLLRVLAKARPYKRTFALAAVLAIILAPLSVLSPYLIQQTVDNYILIFDPIGLNQMLIVLTAVLLLNGALRYLFIYSTNWLGQSVIRDLRVSVFEHITSLRLKYFDKTAIGTSTTRTINDIETINTVFSQGVITIIADILSVIAVLGVMFYTSWELTLIGLTTFPFLVLSTYVFKEKVKESYQAVRTQISKMNAFLQERISGMRIVQIFNAEEKEFKTFDKINKDYTKANIDSILYYSIFFPVIELLSAISLGLAIWWGAKNVISGDLTLGVLIAFPIYLNMLFRPMRMLADKFNTLQMGLVAAERVFGVLDSKEHIENQGTIRPKKLRGDVVFENVEFAYNEGETILHGLSFEIKAGETLAIVGSTGSGKSTIINILNRFYELQGGRVLVDGVDAKDYELSAYRERLAMVQQDVFLFSGTVHENITLRDERISREAVVAAAKMIGAHDFIQKLPNNYDYKVMERGATLSMGQRQLISFVRALVFQPDILILDEATSSIDPESEGIIQHAIEQLIAKRTSIIIAHRLSTIRHAHNIMVLDKGRIVEMGAHEDLLQREDGHYKRLYEMQFMAEA
jgi:ATP-binding cassette, subfamily B, multidrug efflux pump